MATPRGIRGACQPYCAALGSLLLPRLDVLFPLPDLAAADRLHQQQKTYPTKPQRIPTISLSDRAPTSPCRLLLSALVGLNKERLDGTAPNSRYLEGCHDHLLLRPLHSRIKRVLQTVTHECNHPPCWRILRRGFRPAAIWGTSQTLSQPPTNEDRSLFSICFTTIAISARTVEDPSAVSACRMMQWTSQG